MVIHSLFGNALSRESIVFLNSSAKKHVAAVKTYLQQYKRKLHLVQAFSEKWDEEELSRMRDEFGEIMGVNLSEDHLLEKEMSGIGKNIHALMKICDKEMNSKKKGLEVKILRDFRSLFRQFRILEKILSLQLKWFRKHKGMLDQNDSKEKLVDLIKREGVILYSVQSEDLNELLFQITDLLKTYDLDVIQENTYDVCANELERELKEFDDDRVDFSIEKKIKLGGGFKNPVLLVKTSSDCEYVAKAFTEEGAFDESRRARKFIAAAGGLIPKLVRVSDNEIVCEKVSGLPIRKILTSRSRRTNIAFYTLGQSLAQIHKRTLNKVSSYSPRLLFRKGYTKDFERLEDHISLLKRDGLLSEKVYREFMHIRERYKIHYLSIIHGDAHLDNFFFVAHPETVIIVDYDDSKPGDPLADVGRVVASIRNWQFKEKLDNAFVEKVITNFFHGYKSVLNIELEGTNLYAMRLYLIIVKSSQKLIEKVSQLINNDTRFSQQYGSTLIEFFEGNIDSKTPYFHAEEVNRLLEIQFCLEQIERFAEGKQYAVSEKIISIAA